MDGRELSLNQERYEDEIDLAELIGVLIKSKILIIAITIIFSILSFLIGMVQHNNSKKATTIISFNYSEIENGENPDNTLFNKKQIISSLIINKLYTKYPELKEMGITTEDIKEGIKINGIVPNNIYEIAKTALKKGENYEYYPSNYNMELKVTGDKKLDEQLLNEIVLEYIKDFHFNYNTNDHLGKINIRSVDNYDYKDYINILKNSIEIIKNNISNKNTSKFISTRTNLTYEDVIKILNGIVSTDIDKISSFIEVYNITKDKKYLKANYNYIIKELELEKDKKIGEAKVIDEMLKVYKPQERKILVPSIGETGVKISTEEEYYSDLINKALQAKIRVKQIESDINYYQNKIKDMSEYSNENQIEMDEKIDRIIVKINDLIDEINIMNDEYVELNYSDAVKMSVPVETNGESKFMLILAVGTILGLFMGIFAAFVKEFIKGIDFKKIT